MPYLLDTNTVINFLDASIPESGLKFVTTILEDESIISVITQIELLGYNFSDSAEENLIEVFVDASTLLQVSNAIVAKTINIRKSKKIKLPDAIIAATAFVHALVIVSRNISDFSGIDGVQVINPFQI